MAIEVVTEFLSASSVRIWTYIYKNEPNDNSLVDPTAIVISVVDPDGTTQVDETAMTKSTTGIYYYDYHRGTTTAAMDKGRWTGTVKVTDGTGATALITPIPFSFKVK
jgi:hypothetical protein